MIAGLKRNTKLADAPIAHGHCNLQNGLACGAEQVRCLCHAAIQKVLVDGRTIHLPETGFQKGFGDVELLRHLADGQLLIQVFQHVVMNFLYGLQLAPVVIAARTRLENTSPPCVKQIEQLQDFERTEISVALFRQLIQRDEKCLAPKVNFNYCAAKTFLWQGLAF